MYKSHLLLLFTSQIPGSVASINFIHGLQQTFDWAVDGFRNTAGATFSTCQTIDINAIFFDGTLLTTNDMFMLSQTVSGITTLRKLNPILDGFNFRINSGEGETMLTVLDGRGNAGQPALVKVTRGKSCATSDRTNDITLKANTSSSRTVARCDVVGFQIFGGRTPYGIIVTALNSNTPILNATLGRDDDVFLLPNNFQSDGTVSVLVSAVDQDSNWSVSSELFLFAYGSRTPDTPSCGLKVTSGTSKDITLFPSPSTSPNTSTSPSTTIPPNFPSPLIPSNSLVPQQPRKSKAIIIILPIVIILVLVAIAVVLKWRVQGRTRNLRSPVIIPDVWSLPHVERRKTPRLGNDSPSNSKIRSFVYRVAGNGSGGHNGREINEQGERGQEVEQHGDAPGPHLFFHVDAESVQEIPPPYRDRIRPITTPSAGSDEITMVGSDIDTEEEQAGSAEVRVPPAQLQSFTAPFCQDSEVREAPAHPPTYSDRGAKGRRE